MWLITFSIFLTIQLTKSALKLPENVTLPAVIVFGDSIVDQGMNNNLKTLIKANFPPYGKDFMGGLATGRFCNGKTPADILAAELGIKEYVPAYLDPNLQNTELLTGVSFASAGSGFDPHTPRITSAISMEDQLNLFKEYIDKLKALVGEERTNYIIANSLYTVVAGSNDLANTYYTFGGRFHNDVPSYADLVVNSAITVVQGLYDVGARRIAVFGDPPIGCLPLQRTLAGGLKRDCVDRYNQAAQLYNSKLSSQLHAFGNTLPHSNIVYIDIYTPLLDIIQNPQNYGFDVVDRGCCGTGILEVTSFLCNKLSPTCPDTTKYLFWDSYHPTETGYKILVDNVLAKYITKLK